MCLDKLVMYTFSLLFISLFPASPVGPGGPCKAINTKSYEINDQTYMHDIKCVIFGLNVLVVQLDLEGQLRPADER